MLRKIFFTIIISIYTITLSIAQVKTLHAFKTAKPPKIDGLVNDEVWKQAPVATGFIVNQPQFGNTASQKTEVRVLYDDDAIYIAAHLFDDPKLIRRQLTARDNEQRQDVDLFAVAFDTYNDKQNAFQFLVTSANVQSDARISATQINNGNNGLGGGGGNAGIDPNWDAVWDSRVSIVNDGWVVEMKIPYMSLRFARKDVQDWGINFFRSIRRLNESSYWNPVNPNTSGFVNQFGLLKGLQNLTPPLRLSFLPYISTGYSTTPTANGKVNSFIHNGGMDVKYGINQSFTLDMTLVPDFGQTQSDNVVLNLSPFEQQFNENRPFFTEGTELFNKAGIFYSRRVGKIPSGYYNVLQMASDSNYTIIKNPSLTQLYNGSKFSGRTKSNLGIGVFNAVTAPMYAALQNVNGKIKKIETEPLSNYNIIVLDQALKNRSSITFTNTNVLRAGGERNANVTALDLSLFDKKNFYNFQTKAVFSTVAGSDAHNGFKSKTSFRKVSGLWQWGISNNIESDRYDPNDLGYLKAPNEISAAANVSYNQFKPGKHYNFKVYHFNLFYQNLYKPFGFSSLNYNARFLNVFKNFWDVTLELDGSPLWSNDYFELRTAGRKMKRTPWAFAGLFGSTDSRKKLFVRFGGGMARAYDYYETIPFYMVNGGVRYRFNDKFSLEASSRKEFDNGEFGWSHFDAVTNEPVIGQRKVERVDNTLNATYNFKARMNLSVRIRHFWSKVHYVKMFNVDANGEWQFHERPLESGYDDNFNAFNVDAFYTWDFRLGSRLIIAWKNALGPDVSVDGYTFKKYFENLSQTLSSPHSNQLTVKFVYFIDYNQLGKKKTI